LIDSPQFKIIYLSILKAVLFHNPKYLIFLSRLYLYGNLIESSIEFEFTAKAD